MATGPQITGSPTKGLAIAAATGSRTFPVISGGAADRPAVGLLDAGAGEAAAVKLTGVLAGAFD